MGIGAIGHILRTLAFILNEIDRKPSKYFQKNRDMIRMFSESFCLLRGQEPVGKGGSRRIRALRLLLAGNDRCRIR